MMRLLPLFLLLLTLFACKQDDPMAGTLSQNVGASFAPCSEAEIKFLASKHNFMTSFRPCGDNNISAYAWNDAGTHLYFQLVMMPYLMDAQSDTKPTMTVPTSTPIGPAAWVTSYRIVVPVVSDTDEGPNRLAIYDLEQQSIFHTPTTLTSVDALLPTGQADAVFALGTVGDARGAFRVDTSTGQATPVWPWLGEADTLTYSPVLDAVLAGRGNAVTLHQATDGKPMGTWSPATRGVIHPGGRYLMLEHDGPEISIFYQRAWDELSDQARERELRRLKRFEDQLPPGTPTKVSPPTLSWVDLYDGKRFVMSSVYGDHFQWYTATDHYGSFFLWGFEGKQFKRNVMLGNFTGRFRAMARNRTMMGVERFEEGEDSNYVPPKGVEALAEEPKPSSGPAPSDEN